MAYNTDSSFPNSIDERVFVSDIRYDQKGIYDTHQNYIKEGDYDNASNYINSQEGITPITADLMNLMVNRTNALQTYLKTLDLTGSCEYGEEPVSPKSGTIWIE